MKNTRETVFSQRLNEALTELGLSQSELARRIDVTPQAVQRWCNGYGSPRSKYLSAISKATGKPEHWFFLPYGTQQDQASAVVDQPSSASDDLVSLTLTPDEIKLINTYRDLPGVERKRMLDLFELRLEEINKYITEYLLKK
ncbi:helix-turn-helix domain-containing protein [Serratia marcescens]|uniref:helix-turn-helix domain-containing protein n=1 Tax=Serratia sp. CY85266 TaxID=3383697 RepID=UPI0018D7BA6E|nr:helix-turn-helix domain-containing protein [Serratia marcescens]